MTKYGASVANLSPSLSQRESTRLIWRRPTLARAVRLFTIQIGPAREPKPWQGRGVVMTRLLLLVEMSFPLIYIRVRPR